MFVFFFVCFRDVHHDCMSLIRLQKPLSLSQIKRNPFKKTPTSSGKAVASTFKHLTDTAIGFDSQETQDIDFDSVPTRTLDVEKENQITANNTPKLNVSINQAQL